MEKLNLNLPTRIEPTPDPTAFDHALTAAKLGTLGFPFLGAGVTLIDLLTAPMRGRRMNNWCEEFRVSFNELSQKVAGLTPDRLATDDAFFSAFAQATQSAIKTHQKEKLDALRNAVLNVVLGKESNPSRQQQFLSLVDRFSETHLMVLKFLNDPARHFQARGQPVPQLNHVQPKVLINALVTQALPTLGQTSNDPKAASFQHTELVLGELVSSCLVAFQRYQDTWVVPAFAIRPDGGPIGKMTTQLGEDFLAFITEPNLAKE